MEVFIPNKNVAIIGGGIFGCMSAIRLSDVGYNVTLFERLSEPLLGASYNNQNRLHLGYHYPRDLQTAQQCIQGFSKFREKFEDCILSGFDNAYFIAEFGSLTTKEEYINFCDMADLSHRRFVQSQFDVDVNGVCFGLLCDEVVYDSALLRSKIKMLLDMHEVNQSYNTNVSEVIRDHSNYTVSTSKGLHKNYDVVINCTYADINRITEQLGFKTKVRQYEYTIVPIIDWIPNPIGITIMDGHFMTILPFGKTGKFLLYHVEHSVIDRINEVNLPGSWLNVDDSPASKINKYHLFRKIRKSCEYFVPSLSNAKYSGFLEGPRMVLARHDDDDARPSIVEQHETGYLTVFSGKIDHCIWVADEVVELLA